MARLRHLFAPLLALFAALGAWRAIASPDAFWHLASGRWMLEHGSIPRHDPFRFTSGGEAWIDHEWGFQLLLAMAESLAGSAGLLAFRSAVFALLAWLLWRLAIRITNAETGGPREMGLSAVLGFALLVTVDGLQARMPLRPELLTLLFFAVLLWILESARQRPGRVWFAAVLTAVWVNVHPGAMVAPGIVFLHLLGRRVQHAAQDESPSWRQVLGAPAAAVLALGLNPWGFHVVVLPLRIRAALADLPASNPDWQRLWHDPPLMLLLVLLFLAMVAIRACGRRTDLPTAFVLAATVGLTITAVRFQGLAWIAALVFAARIGHEHRDVVEDLGRRFTPLVVAMLVLGCGVEGWRASQATAGVQPDRFPAAGVTALDEWDRDSGVIGGGVGNLFNSAVFGGYVLYRSFPPRQIFVDTRNEVDPSILRQLADARSDARAWRALVDRYQLDAALLRYEDRPRQVLGPPMTPGGEPTVEFHTTSALLFPQSDWALVHWDDVSMLFLRRTGARAAALAESEYRFAQPENVQATLQRAASDSEFRTGLLRDLHRKLEEDPESRRARALVDALAPRGAGIGQ